jgi:arylsulfatase
MKDNRPHIIFVITDQQRLDTIAALGHDHMNTPNLDRLVNEGVTFTNCFVTAPSCAPSRASLFTGYYPHTTGIYRNGDVWRHSWIEQLSASGYHCVNVGKMHTYPYETHLGFDERFVVENKDRYLEGRYFFDRWDMALQAQGIIKQQRELYRKLDDYQESLGAFEWKLPPNTHSDVFVGELAQWWIGNKPQTAPLFLQIGFPGPHPPFDPLAEYVKPYLEKELPLPEVLPEHLAGQTKALQHLRQHNCEIDHDSILWSMEPDSKQLHRMRAHYFANITMIDEQIGGILKMLEDKQYLDNSVLVFTSDHGENLGDHGHIQKWNMYDEVTRVPMIVWAPGRFAAGRKVDQLCQHFDIVPVLLELAGLSIPDSMPAQSLMAALVGDRIFEGRQYVFSENADPGRLDDETRQMTMIRSEQWKLVHYLGSKGEGELYDLMNDPAENNNLWNRPGYEEIKTNMLHELLNWKIESSLATSKWPEPWR